jgi:AmmeMemoRadiSam system protein B
VQIHTGAGPSVSVFPAGDWDTPLGRASVDSEFVDGLLKHSSFCREDESAHRYEHSIEVQLPFLQFLFGHIKFVAIVMRGLQVLQESLDLARAIEATAKEQKKKVVVLASSDLTHYGPAYMYTPLKGKLKDVLKKIDSPVLKDIEHLKEIDFLKHIVRTNATICGYPAITAAILYAKLLKIKKGKLLKHYNSSEISKDKANAVDYASIIFSD